MYVSIRAVFLVALSFAVVAPERASAQVADDHAHHVPAPADELHAAMTHGREASGTSWLPDETPIDGAMWHRLGPQPINFSKCLIEGF